MIDPGHKRLSIVRQCALVSISRASFYRPPASESPENLALMRLIDEVCVPKIRFARKRVGFERRASLPNTSSA